MNALSKLRRYLLDFRRQHNDSPKSIPVSRAEAIEVMNDSGPFVQDIALTPSAPQIFGLDMEEHDFAPMIRERRLRVPICDFLQEYPVNAAMRHNVEFIAREGVARIRAHILADKTRVRVTLDWDIFARVKKWFRIKPRQRTVEIDCTVLYPHCKVQLPHNRHYLHSSWHQPCSPSRV